jgi:hypothetical protein
MILKLSEEPVRISNLGQSYQPTLSKWETVMPLFLIERNFAEELILDASVVAEVRQINDEIGIQWLYSFLSADKRKTYCLYEAPSAESIRIAAGRLNIPADVIIPVSEVRPERYEQIPIPA